jgi:hypothetical protein
MEQLATDANLGQGATCRGILLKEYGVYVNTSWYVILFSTEGSSVCIILMTKCSSYPITPMSNLIERSPSK